NTYVVELPGMNNDEASKFIDQRLRFLKMDKLVSDQNELAPLNFATGGNPLAIEMALGYIKYNRQPFQQVLDDLYNARGEHFDKLFQNCWSVLDDTAKRILLTMTIFP